MIGESKVERLLRVKLLLSGYRDSIQEDASPECALHRFDDGRVSVRHGDAEPQVFERHVVESYVVDPIYAELGMLTAMEAAAQSAALAAPTDGSQRPPAQLNGDADRIKELRRLIKERGW